MREEFYTKVKSALEGLLVDQAGEYNSESGERAIKHIDLWNHNVEFIEQETAWERPAVFIEFTPMKWYAIVPQVEYRAEAEINLHIVTDWAQESGAEQFRLLDAIHKVMVNVEGDNFAELDLVKSTTNHNHEDIIENIETYVCVAFRSIQK